MQTQQLLSLQSFVDYSGATDDLIEKGIALSGNFVDFLGSQSFSDLGTLTYRLKGTADQLLTAAETRGRLFCSTLPHPICRLGSHRPR